MTARRAVRGNTHATHYRLPEGFGMTTSDAALCVNLAEAVQFSAEARVNREIMTTDDLIIRMNCSSPIW